MGQIASAAADCISLECADYRLIRDLTDSDTEEEKEGVEIPISGILLPLSKQSSESGDNHSSKRRNPRTKPASRWSLNKEDCPLFGLAPAEVYLAISVT